VSQPDNRSALPRGQAFLASAALSILFLFVYGGCNWITSQRSAVGTLYFEWERHIPFVPFFVVPYLSIDLFFIAAPFFCRDREELRLFCRRVTAAILIAGACFLLLPLRFAFDRPSVAGWAGKAFDSFRQLDAPYNLLPSLHAAFLPFLFDIYRRNLRGIVRWAVLVWLVLIAFSPILTYQHHVLDILGGFILAVCCFYFIRALPEQHLVVSVNPRIGGYYLIGGLITFGMAFMLWPIGALFLWPTASLILVGSAYLWTGPGIFRKQTGKIPGSARLVLAPCLLGQYFSLIYYERKCRRWDKMAPRLWIGRFLREREARQALAAGVTAVLDLTAEFSESAAFCAVRYRNIPILDLTAPTILQLAEMADFIKDESRDGIVYVHCKIGYSRSAAAVIAAMLANGAVHNVAEGVRRLRAVRPTIVIRPEILAALSAFERERCESLVLTEREGT
jgi:membrane-associated phospholipid phosphatase/rhodanese-related sulfurtransferase